MHFSSFAALLALATNAAGRSLRHVGREDLPNSRAALKRAAFEEVHYSGEKRSVRPEIKYHKRAGSTIVPQNKNTTRYAVNGTSLPDVHFDIGESYAGLMPTSDAANATREFYFWYFPSSNPNATDEITIWLNGGPGCSSLEGLLQENGPFIWQYGTYQPIQNPWTWQKLTNMLWVEQPIGTGFTQGQPTATNETQVAQEFLGFFKRFIDTFAMQGRKVYITGESYAGAYVPYIASEMFKNGNKDYYDVQGIMIYDPSTSTSAVQVDIPVVPFVEYNQNLFNFNVTYMQDLQARDVSCGYAAFREKYMTFPPPGILPAPPNNYGDCSLWDDVLNAVLLINPCFDIYQVATTCPLLWDVLGFPGTFDYRPIGAPPIYFNRPAVQKAINAPIQQWRECSYAGLSPDTSPPSGLSVLPGVIEKCKRTVIGHGALDMVLIANGTLMMIQNMTWNGKQGFQSPPKTPFHVPYHSSGAYGTLAGAGRFGTTHTERGLTWVEVVLSGHMVPQYAPSASFRHLEFLLGRIDSLNSPAPFTV